MRTLHVPHILMVNKHTNCNVLLIKGVRNKCDISHSAATIRTCTYAMHLPFLYPLSWHVHSMMTILSQSCLIQNGWAIWLDASWGGMGGIICNGYFTVVLVTSVGVSFRK